MNVRQAFLKCFQQNQLERFQDLLAEHSLTCTDSIPTDSPFLEAKPFLNDAALFPCPSILSYLLEHGANPNHIESKGGGTPIMRAALANDIPNMSLLTAYGADINHVTKQGITALIIAAINHHTEATIWLIQQGADLNAMDDDEDSLLSCLQKRKWLEVLDVIEEEKHRFSAENLQLYKQLRLGLLFQ